jgi:hypothetical protein
MNVLIVSADADYRDIHTLGLRDAGFSAKSVGSADEVPDVVRHCHAETIVFHFAEESWTRRPESDPFAARKVIHLRA